jgi:hypothetical protein
MQITSLTVSADKTQLDLVLDDAASATILRLWNDSTYKNFAQVIDLSAKLDMTGSQEIAITLYDIAEPYFDGIYYIEAKSPTETANQMTSELGRFKECIMDKLTQLNTCDECLKSKNQALMNAHSSLLSLEDAVALNFPAEAQTIKRALDKYCSNTCRSCGDFSNIVTSSSRDTLNPDSVIIKMDGGSLD